MKKRYWLFSLPYEETSAGGMENFVADFNTLENLKGSKSFKKHVKLKYADLEIYDLHEDEIIEYH